MQRHKSLIMISRIELISYFGKVLRGIYYNHLGFSYFKFKISKTAANSGRQKLVITMVMHVGCYYHFVNLKID